MQKNQSLRNRIKELEAKLAVQESNMESHRRKEMPNKVQKVIDDCTGNGTIWMLVRSGRCLSGQKPVMWFFNEDSAKRAQDKLREIIPELIWHVDAIHNSAQNVCNF